MSCLLSKDLGDMNLSIFQYENVYVLRIEYEQYKGTFSIFRQEYSKEKIEDILTDVLLASE